jgi:phosphate transport system substrate-binding protein
MTAGSIVLAYNVPDAPELKLSREVYVDILLGNITNWNDERITADNPDVTLPDLPITVVYRSDGSGTTGVFTMHLSAISEDWKNSVGEGKTVQWPVGVGAPKNDGVTAQIQQTPGAIGYVEYGFANTAGLPMASLENQSGNFIKPTADSASATLDAVTLPENLREFITDPQGDQSYPIVTYTWLLAYQNYDDPEKAKALEATIEYALTEGQNISGELGYIPLPPSVVQKVAAQADKISPDYQINVQ